jgi:hypothetical protein
MDAVSRLRIEADRVDAERAAAAIFGEDDDDEEFERLPERQEEMLVAIFYGMYYPKNAATRLALSEKGMIVIEDKDTWDISLSGEGEAYLAQHGLMPPQSKWQVGQAVTNSGETGRVLKTDGYYAYVEVGNDSAWYHEDHLTDVAPLLDETPAEQPPLPDWAKPGRLVRNTSTDITGKVLDARWNDNWQEWYLNVAFPETTGEVPLAMLEANDPVPILPEWAEAGKTVRHIQSRVQCTVIRASLDVTDMEWILHAMASNGGEDAAPLRDFEPMDAAPRERHPALHPENLTRVITEQQYRLPAIGAAAVELKMYDELKQIDRMKVLTPRALETFLREEGQEAGYARVLAMYDAGMKVLMSALDALNAVRDEAYEVLRQMADEQRGQ